MSAALSNLSIGVLSYAAHKTLTNTLETHQAAGLGQLSDDFFVYFNSFTDADRELAARFGVRCTGTDQNRGIYGGFCGIVSHARHRYVLILENDIVSLGSASEVAQCLSSAISDMAAYDIKAMSLRSRLTPGQGAGAAQQKYAGYYGIHDPIRPEIARSSPSIMSKVRYMAKYVLVEPLIGCSYVVERHPEQRHPQAIRKLSSGNYMTTSRYQKWSNQSVLVEKDFFTNVICRRVEERPDPRTVNGFQDIERAIVGGVVGLHWWRSLGVRIGQAAEGCFSHRRLDREGTGQPFMPAPSLVQAAGQ